MKPLTLSATLISPPNDADDGRLVDAMRRDGWTGRPLLVKSEGDGYIALTGAHRLAAAVKLGIEVPVLLIEDDDLDFDAWVELDEENDAEDLLALLREHGLTEVAEVLAQESSLNTRRYLDYVRSLLRPSDF